MEKRYKVLRFIATLYKVLGVVLFSITVLGAIGICATSIWGGVAFETISRDLSADPNFANFFSSVFGGVFVGFFLLLYGGFISLATYAFGEGIYLLLAMEENTRASTLLLQRQLSPEPAIHSPAPSQVQKPAPDTPQQPSEQGIEDHSTN
jgi:hypothetical protein